MYAKCASRLIANFPRHFASAHPRRPLIAMTTAHVDLSPRLQNGHAPSRGHKVLTMETLNPHIREMQYAVRGPIVTRAAEIEKELEQGADKPFTEVIRANIGDAHAMGQHPVTFLRQVVALCTFPDLLKSSDFPEDAKDRARKVLSGCKGHSIGAYSDSAGVEVIRRDIARYITERDGGIPCHYSNVFLSTGASDSIRAILALMMRPTSQRMAGVMIPIPQYPLYSACSSEMGFHSIPYYLNEDNNWGLDVQELQRALDKARPNCEPRAIVIINPGNPTGQVLSKKNIEDVIKFARQEGLFILADEVYQHNIYAKGSSFHSFKKVMTELGPEYADSVELASFNSTSKGYAGECGFRGGYCEVANMDPEIFGQLMKSISAKLCPSVSGQAAMECVVNPPSEDEPSHALFVKERDHILGQLALKARMTTETLNSIEGVSCNEVMGAMYAFPNVQIPEKAILLAKEQGLEPDAFYCFELLEATGICVVPGSGFGQVDGTYHFRMTILPSVDLLEKFLQRFKDFHLKFTEKYR